jgi:hypothetical protein
MKTKLFIFFCLFLSYQFSFSQEEKRKLRDAVNINGYVKYLPSTTFLNLDDFKFDHLIHNRINFRGDLFENFTIKLELRNRVFFGNTVNTSQPFYGEFIGRDNGEVDMSYLLVNNDNVIINTMIDRAYLDFSKGKWEVRAGRQRINWGVNLLWNTNDLFNAYNFVDFDYQERPGSDALRIQYFTGDLSSIDVAYKPGEDFDNTILAGLIKFNKWKYDFQILGANYYTDVAIGGGWAGNIKGAGFKGEATLFQPKTNFSDTSGVFLASTSVDYSFKKGIYINGSFLYNSNGLDAVSSSQQSIFASNLTVKTLMPSKYAYFVQISGSFNPKLAGSFSSIYGQGMNILFLMPSLSYSVRENWDTDITGQVYFGEQNNQFKNLGNAIFLRIRYSY